MGGPTAVRGEEKQTENVDGCGVQRGEVGKENERASGVGGWGEGGKDRTKGSKAREAQGKGKRGKGGARAREGSGRRCRVAMGRACRARWLGVPSPRDARSDRGRRLAGSLWDGIQSAGSDPPHGLDPVVVDQLLL